MPTLGPELCLHVCIMQANVLISGVVVIDVKWVVPNCSLDNMVHSNMFDVLLNCQHSNMLFMRMLHVKTQYRVSYLK